MSGIQSNRTANSPRSRGPVLAEQGSTRSGQTDRTPATLWANVGIVNEHDVLVSPFGIPLDKVNPKAIKPGFTEETVEQVTAENDLLEQFMQIGATLAPGETSRRFTVTVEIRRVGEALEVVGGNKHLVKLA